MINLFSFYIKTKFFSEKLVMINNKDKILYIIWLTLLSVIIDFLILYFWWLDYKMSFLIDRALIFLIYIFCFSLFIFIFNKIFKWSWTLIDISIIILLCFMLTIFFEFIMIICFIFIPKTYSVALSSLFSIPILIWFLYLLQKSLYFLSKISHTKNTITIVISWGLLYWLWFIVNSLNLFIY